MRPDTFETDDLGRTWSGDWPMPARPGHARATARPAACSHLDRSADAAGVDGDIAREHSLSSAVRLIPQGSPNSLAGRRRGELDAAPRRRGPRRNAWPTDQRAFQPRRALHNQGHRDRSGREPRYRQAAGEGRELAAGVSRHLGAEACCRRSAVTRHGHARNVPNPVGQPISRSRRHTARRSSTSRSSIGSPAS